MRIGIQCGIDCILKKLFMEVEVLQRWTDDGYVGSIVEGLRKFTYIKGGTKMT